MPLRNVRTRPTPRQIRQWVDDAARSCRCDGGGTVCGACIAERHLSKLDEVGARLARQHFTLGGTATFGARIDCSKPNRANKPKSEPRVKWVVHNNYAHVKGQPCGLCDGARKPASDRWMLQTIGNYTAGWRLRLIRGVVASGKHVHYSAPERMNTLNIEGPTSLENCDRIRAAIREWIAQGAPGEIVLTGRL